MNYGGAAAGMMALVLALKRRQLVRTFETLGAVSAATAREREALGLGDSRMFRRLVRRGVLCEASAGLYYLDTAVLERDTRRRRTVLALVLAIVVTGLVIAWWLA